MRIYQYSLKSLVQFSRALSEETRLRIVMLLSHGELCVCDLMAILGESQSKISRHLAYLKHSGIASSKRAGVWIHYSLKKPLDEKFQFHLQVLKKRFSSLPPFNRDIKKLLNLKAQSGCKGMITSKSTRRPKRNFRHTKQTVLS